MIRNGKQFAFARRLFCAMRIQRRIFVQQLSSPSDGALDRVLAEHDSKMEALQKELSDYRMLKAGDAERPDLKQVQSLAVDLVRARILIGWSQRELGRRLGLNTLQIQRYEKSGYRSARFDRIKAVSKVLDDALDDRDAWFTRRQQSCD